MTLNKILNCNGLYCKSCLIYLTQNLLTKFFSQIENQIDRYMLVMDDADGGTLQDYLKKNFHNLTWNDKFNLAFQLANAVSYLHEEGIKIVHGDLVIHLFLLLNN